ncbi:uncharacterized protein L969DRAFT_195434 [Mixia osmundae IAM 14324]|uniref:Uncharacterized protein n=1 Tax=Mixia osmundae (strain CBS 9802 / IAM 14324 / JCM 22182 / KY 12970) TaxID=764103 RepID=G7DWF8_MIXOS|nr:uncharacterized protein L969DRAFT_195434 [Mixia osmundae IAM 14324]KEI37320.1 hypothetical protein L969DRAFT_195434 [Mixia osmundae IAM 14324]GAA94918.1 hypothetical protein E5Q_01573 [Mixia osmundae IAM 14324]
MGSLRPKLPDLEEDLAEFRAQESASSQGSSRFAAQVKAGQIDAPTLRHIDATDGHRPEAFSFGSGAERVSFNLESQSVPRAAGSAKGKARVVGEIRESHESEKPSFAQADLSSTGFPIAQHRSQRGSRFRQAKEIPPASSTPIATMEASTSASKLDSSEDTAISRENEERLAGLSPGEIEQARREVLAQLNPSLISFLEKRQSKTLSQQNVVLKTIPSEEEEPRSEAKELRDLRDQFFPDEPLHPLATDAPVEHAHLPPASEHEPRFTADGRQADKNNNLAHTITQILAMTGSTAISQRRLALSTARNILADSENLALLGQEANFRETIATAVKCAARALADRDVTCNANAIQLYSILWPDNVGASDTKQQLARTASTTLLNLEPPPLARLQQHLNEIISTFEEDPTGQCKLTVMRICLLLRHMAKTAIEMTDAIVSTPGLLEAACQAAHGGSWPPIRPAHLPLSEAVYLLTDLVRASRDYAVAILDRKLPDGLLRFVSLPHWRLSSKADLSSEGKGMLAATFELWNALACYGLGCSVRTSAMSSLATIEIDLLSKWRVHASDAESWLTLACTWATCALDPHQTTPEHDITWSQVQSWLDSACTLADEASKSLESLPARRVLGSAYTLISIIVTGSMRKSPTSPITALVSARVAAHHLSVEIFSMLLLGAEENDPPEAMTAMSHAFQGRMLLSRALSEPRSKRSRPLFVAIEEVAKNIDDLALQNLLCVGFARLDVPPKEKLSAICSLLPYLADGMQPEAIELVKLALELTSHLELLPHYETAISTRMKTLRTGALPRSELLKVYARQQAPLPSIVEPTEHDGGALPPAWPFMTLDALLSEDYPRTREIVQQIRQTFDFARDLALCAEPIVDAKRVSQWSPGDLVYQIFRFYCLAAKESGSSQPLFLEQTVAEAVDALLQPFRSPRQKALKSGETAQDACIKIARRERTNTGLFLQQYQDLLAFNAAYSMPESSSSRGQITLQALLLLPLVTDSYAHDYRRLLFIDYAHSLPSFTLAASDLILESSGGLTAFFKPAVSDLPTLQALLDSLITDRVERSKQPFIHSYAKWHVAAAIASKSNYSASLLTTLLTKASDEVVRSVFDAQPTSTESLAARKVSWQSLVPNHQTKLKERLQKLATSFA